MANQDLDRSRPPGPRGLQLVRAIPAARRDFRGFLESVARRYGGVAATEAGPLRAFLVSAPDQVAEVLDRQRLRFPKGGIERAAARHHGQNLNTADHALHDRRRRILQPIFERQLSGFGPVMVELATYVRDRWRDGRALDVHAQMMWLNAAVRMRTLFGLDLREPAGKEMLRALEATNEAFRRLPLPFSRTVARLPLPANRRFAAARAQLDSLIYRLIEDRRSPGAGGQDMLSMLLEARAEPDGEGLSNEAVRDEAVGLYQNGRSSVAASLSWTWHLLADRPDAEERMLEEIDAVLAGRPPAVEDLPRLEYSGAVLAESLRLFPPTWAVVRHGAQDGRLGGYPCPAGAIVVVSQYIVHRDPDLHPGAADFRPERWVDGSPAPPPASYFPFGLGARDCIGEPFARMQALLVLATIAERWRLASVPGRPPVQAPGVTLTPRYGMWMIPERRGSAASG